MSGSESDRENEDPMDASDEYEDSDNEEDRSSSPKRKTRKSKKVIRQIPYEEAMEELRRMSEALPAQGDGNDESQGSRSRSKKRTAKLTNLKAGTWEEIVAAVDKESNKAGLPNDDLDIIWNVLSHPLTPIPDKFSSKLIICMIPVADPIGHDRISDIIFQISSFGTKTKLATLKYLLGLFDYNLCAKESFSEYPSYCRIFFTGRTSVLIPWICALMKRITTTKLIPLSFINDTMDLIRRPLLGTAALRAIVDLLRYFKLLRPDLLPYNVFRLSAIGASKKVTLDEQFQESLYNAKCRILGIQPGADGNSMEIDNNEPDCDRIANFLSKLNALCFPGFQIHLNGDPEPDNYTALLKMSKFDKMRCALKTKESIPFIVSDPEVFECFNTYVSLILKHKFDDYAPKDENRYKFILTRIWEVTVIGQRSIPAVNDWLLDYLRLWNGLLFKFQIYELLSWLPPVDFSDGYIYVLYKFETLFLYGEDVDRMLVWNTLTKLASDWIFELGVAMDEEADNVPSLTESVGFLLDFIHSLVGKVSTFDGHKDEAFLFRCCNSYTELNRCMNELKNPPFYVLPSIYLWVMVVLSDSLNVIDAFCDFVNKYGPRRSLNHLRKTERQEMYRKWNQEVIPDVFTYFGMVEGESAIFTSVFASDLVGLEDAIDENSVPELNQLGDQCKSKMENLLAGLSRLTAITSTAFQNLLLDPDSNLDEMDFLNLVDEDKMQELAPNVLHLLQRPTGPGHGTTTINSTQHI